MKKGNEMKKILVLLFVFAFQAQAQQMLYRVPKDTVVTVTNVFRGDSINVGNVPANKLRFYAYNSTTDTIRIRLCTSWADTVGSGKNVLLPPAPTGGISAINYYGEGAAQIRWVSAKTSGTSTKIIINFY